MSRNKGGTNLKQSSIDSHQTTDLNQRSTSSRDKSPRSLDNELTFDFDINKCQPFFILKDSESTTQNSRWNSLATYEPSIKEEDIEAIKEKLKREIILPLIKEVQDCLQSRVLGSYVVSYDASDSRKKSTTSHNSCPLVDLGSQTNLSRGQNFKIKKTIETTEVEKLFTTLCSKTNLSEVIEFDRSLNRKLNNIDPSQQAEITAIKIYEDISRIVDEKIAQSLSQESKLAARITLGNFAVSYLKNQEIGLPTKEIVMSANATNTANELSIASPTNQQAYNICKAIIKVKQRNFQNITSTSSRQDYSEQVISNSFHEELSSISEIKLPAVVQQFFLNLTSIEKYDEFFRKIPEIDEQARLESAMSSGAKKKEPDLEAKRAEKAKTAYYKIIAYATDSEIKRRMPVISEESKEKTANKISALANVDKIQKEAVVTNGLNHARKNPSLEEMKSEFFSSRKMDQLLIGGDGKKSFLSISQYKNFKKFEQILLRIANGKNDKRNKPIISDDTGEGKTYTIEFFDKYAQEIAEYKENPNAYIRKNEEQTASFPALAAKFKGIIKINLSNQNDLQTLLDQNHAAESLKGYVFIIDENVFIQKNEEVSKKLMNAGANVILSGATQNPIKALMSSVRQKKKVKLLQDQKAQVGTTTYRTAANINLHNAAQTAEEAKSKASEELYETMLKRREKTLDELDSSKRQTHFDNIQNLTTENLSQNWHRIPWKTEKQQTKNITQYIIPTQTNESSTDLAEKIQVFRQTAVVDVAMASFEENGRPACIMSTTDGIKKYWLQSEFSKAQKELFYKTELEDDKIGNFEEFKEEIRKYTKQAHVFLGQDYIGRDFVKSTLGLQDSQEIVLGNNFEPNSTFLQQAVGRNRQTEPETRKRTALNIYSRFSNSEDFAEACKENSQKNDLKEFCNYCEEKLYEAIYKINPNPTASSAAIKNSVALTLENKEITYKIASGEMALKLDNSGALIADANLSSNQKLLNLREHFLRYQFFKELTKEGGLSTFEDLVEGRLSEVNNLQIRLQKNNQEESKDGSMTILKLSAVSVELSGYCDKIQNLNFANKDGVIKTLEVSGLFPQFQRQDFEFINKAQEEEQNRAREEKRREIELAAAAAAAQQQNDQELQAENERLKNELLRLNNYVKKKIQEISTENKRLEEEKKQLEEEEKQRIIKVSKEQSKALQMLQLNLGLEERIKALESELLETKLAKETAEEKNVSLKEAFRQLESSLRESGKEKQKLIEEKEAIELVQKNLQNELSETQNKSEEIASLLRAQLKNLEENLALKQKNIKSKEEEEEKLRSKLREITQEKEDQSLNLANLSKEVDRLANEVKTKDLSLNELSSKIYKIQDTIYQKTKEYDELKKLFNERESEYSLLSEEEKVKLENRIKELTENSQSSEARIKELETLNKELEQLKTLNQILQTLKDLEDTRQKEESEEVKNLKKELEDSREKLEQLRNEEENRRKEEIKSKENEIAELKAKIELSEKNSESANQLKLEKATLEGEIKVLQESLKTREEQKNVAVAQKEKELNESILELKVSKATLEEKENALKRELEAKNAEIAQINEGLNLESKEKQALQSRIDSLKSVLEEAGNKSDLNQQLALKELELKNSDKIHELEKEKLKLESEQKFALKESNRLEAERDKIKSQLDEVGRKLENSNKQISTLETQNQNLLLQLKIQELQAQLQELQKNGNAEEKEGVGKVEVDTLGSENTSLRNHREYKNNSAFTFTRGKLTTSHLTLDEPRGVEIAPADNVRFLKVPSDSDQANDRDEVIKAIFFEAAKLTSTKFGSEPLNAQFFAEKILDAQEQGKLSLSKYAEEESNLNKNQKRALKHFSGTFQKLAKEHGVHTNTSEEELRKNLHFEVPGLQSINIPQEILQQISEAADQTQNPETPSTILATRKMAIEQLSETGKSKRR